MTGNSRHNTEGGISLNGSAPRGDPGASDDTRGLRTLVSGHRPRERSGIPCPRW